MRKLIEIGKPNNSAEPANEFKATAVLPYVKGLSEQLRRCLQQQGVRAVFKSETTLRSQLVRPKDAVDPAKQDGVFYRISCECSKVHIGETGRPMLDRIIDRDPYYYTRRVKEAIHIRLHPNNINRDSGIEIPEAWMPTIKKHNNRRAVGQRTAEGVNH